MVPNKRRSIILSLLASLGVVVVVVCFQSRRFATPIGAGEGSLRTHRGIPIVVDSTKPNKFAVPEVLKKAGVVVRKSSPAETVVTQGGDNGEPEERLQAVADSGNSPREEGSCDVLADVRSYCECVQGNGTESDMELYTLYPAKVDGVGFNINMYKSNDIVSISIKNYGKWELTTSRALVKAMEEHYQRLKANDSSIEKKDVKFLDIGANIGWFSILVASRGFGVISVEPMVTNLRGFKHSICENNFQDLITIHETALAEEPTMCKLFSITYNVGDGTIVCGDDWKSSDPANPQYVFRQNVTFSRLDDLVPPEDIKYIGVVKMDVEGYEDHVVRGANQTLLHGGIPKILSEFGPWLMHDAKSDPVKYLETFRDAGYTVRRDSFDTGQVLSTKEEFDNLEKITEIGVVFFEKQ